MTKKPEFVQIEAGEDVNSVRDRLSFIRGQRVLVIWPEEGTALTRKLDLVLLQREAMRRAIRLALVTHDPRIIEHARELNISTFETIGASERSRWKRGRAKVFTNRFQRPKDEPEPEDLMDVASRVRLAPNTMSRLRHAAVRILVLVMLVGVTLGAAYAVVPSATVVITPVREQITVDAEIVADPDIQDVDIENGIIPATRLLVEVEQTATIPTTGVESLPDVLAQGSVIFVNKTDRVIDIPAGTVVSTSSRNPIQFQTTENAALDSGEGQQLEVPIEALPGSIGEQGNVDSGLINTVVGPLESSVTVFNIAPTAGGESRKLPVVTLEDQASLLGAVRGLIQAQAYTAMLPNLSETQVIIESTIHIAEERSDWKQYSAKPGDIAENLTLTMRAIVEAKVIDRKLAQQIAFTRMADQIARGRIIQPETLVYDCCPVLSIDDQSRITVRITGSGTVTSQINSAALQEQLSGRSVEDALRYLMGELDLANGTTPQISLSPTWMNQLPLLPIRINIRVQAAS